jgi:hypothetical protein
LARADASVIFTEASSSRTETAEVDATEFDGCLSEIAKGPFRTVAVFDDLGHPIAATRIDGGD